MLFSADKMRAQTFGCRGSACNVQGSKFRVYSRVEGSVGL